MFFSISFFWGAIKDEGIDFLFPPESIIDKERFFLDLRKPFEKQEKSNRGNYFPLSFNRLRNALDSCLSFCFFFLVSLGSIETL